MGLLTSKAKGSKQAGKRVVATGKRIKGTWVMESLLSPKPRRSKSRTSTLAGENRRVRTLH
jgi:hypothetical protein